MTFSVTVSADSPGLLHRQLMIAAAALVPSTTPEIAAQPETPASEPQKKGRGRPRKDAATAAEPVQADIEDMTASDEDPNEPAPTYEQVVDALKEVNGKHGMAAVRAIILPYGAQKISEVKPVDFAAVIKAAKEKAAA